MCVCIKKMGLTSATVVSFVCVYVMVCWCLFHVMWTKSGNLLATTSLVASAVEIHWLIGCFLIGPGRPDLLKVDIDHAT